MVDTQRSLSAVLALLADNTAGDISAQDARDTVVSLRPDNGSVFQVNNASATTISDTVSFFPCTLSGTTLGSTSFNFDSPSSGRLRYTGAATRTCQILAKASIVTVGSNQEIHLDLAKNAIVSGEAESRKMAGTGTDIETVPLYWTVSLANNDFIELYAKNITSATNLTVVNFMIQAVGLIE